MFLVLKQILLSKNYKIYFHEFIKQIKAMSTRKTQCLIQKAMLIDT